MVVKRRGGAWLIIGAGLVLIAAPAAASETVTYAYDARGRLVQVTRSGNVNNGVIASYAYDKADNRTNVTVSGARPSGSGDPNGGSAQTGAAFVVVPLLGGALIPTR